MSKYTKPIPLDKLPETPAVYGEMIEEYNETKKTVSRDIEVEGLGKGRLVLSKQNKGKPFFYADEANIEANQKAAKQLQTAETVANLPLILAPFFTIAKGGQRIIKQRRDNQIKKSALAAEDLDKVNNVIDLVKSKASGTAKPVIPTKTTAPTKSILDLYKGNITPQQKKILSTIVLQQGTANDIESYGFGPEGPRGGATDAEIMQAYRERTGELDLDPSRRIQPTPRRRKSKISPGQLFIDFSYSNLNEQIEKEPLLTDEDLTDEERIRYGQMNAESAISLEEYLTQFGASTISRKRIKTYMLEPFKAKYGATDAQVREYVKLANRNTRDIEATIKYLNYEYKLSQPAVNIDNIAAEMSLLFGQNITPETIDAIIQGQGGKILYQTDGMKRRREPAIEITDRESLLNAYVARLNLLNTHGAFDKGHVYAADQILRDNKVSNASMFRNLEPEIRASIQQLVSDVEIEQLIKGQLTKNKDYIDVIIGNRSKQAGGDPADKIFERLYGNAYGLEEDFKNFLFPNQNLANMIHPDLKPLFGRKYTNLVKQKLKNFEGLTVGSHTLNIIRLEAMQEVLRDYVAGTEITEEERKAQDSLARVQAFLDFVTQKDMVNREGEAKRGDE